MLRDARASVRQKDDSKIVIAGVDVKGSAFDEMTEARDISEESISFYLHHPIWINAHLTAEVISSSSLALKSTRRVMVVRIQADASGKRLVAARFNE